MTAANGTAKKSKPSEIALDMDDLDLQDCLDVEEVTGQDAGAIFAGLQVGQYTIKTIAALIWVAKRKTDPTFTFEDAKRTKVSAIPALMGQEDDAGPSQG